MNTTVKNILILVGGTFVGMLMNGGLIAIGPNLIPPPEGVDMTTPEGLAAGMELLQPKNFIIPFLAHALGTLVGAFIVAKFAETNKLNLALVVGVLFFIGGVMMIVSVGGPLWFQVLDLVGAYFPMAWLGYRLSK